MSKVMKGAAIRGELKGLRFTLVETLSNILFVDDVLLFGVGDFQKFLGIHQIMDLFCQATEMEINWKKPFIHLSFPREYLSPLVESSLPFPHKILKQGFKFMGFHLNPNNYWFED
jgi:hypothetical protein